MKTLLFGNGAVSLDDVYPYQNINSAPEAAFDDLTRLAACVCQTPIALLCLIDGRRWWLKSQVGLEEGATDSYLALCTETMLQPEGWDSHLLMVEDALADRRFASYDLVKSQQKVRFYAGAPLVTPQGLILGILSAIDRVPRSLSLQQQEALVALSKQTIAQLELHKNSTNLTVGVNKSQLIDHACADVQLYAKENRDKSFSTTKAIAQPDKVQELEKSSPATSDREQAYREADPFFILSSELLCVVGLDGYFKRVNPEFAKTLSYTTEELLTRAFLDFVHPEDKAVTLAELEKLTSNTLSICFENRYCCQDGTYKRLAWRAFWAVEEKLVYAIAQEINKSKETKATLLNRGSERAAPVTDFLTLEADVGAALVGQNGTLSKSLKRCTEAMVQHVDAIGVGIWTVNPATIGSQDLLQLDLQASSGYLIPTDIFPHHIFPNHKLFDLIIQSKQPLHVQLSAQSKVVEDEKQQKGQERQGEFSDTPSSPKLLSSLSSLASSASLAPSFFSGYPLIIESRLVGVIALHSQQPFSEVVHGVLGWVANAIAVAIDRVWAREELLSRREALLFRLAGQIRNSLNLNTILDTAVAEIRNLLDVDCCHFLWCWSESEQPSLSVTHEACKRDLPSLLGESPPPYLARLAKKIRNLETLRIDDLTEASGLDAETRSFLRDSGMTSGLLLPLKTNTGQLGAIVCTHYEGPRVWTNYEVELLQAVVDQLAIAIEHAELFAKTRAAALAAQTQARQLEIALHDLQQTESRLIQTEKMSSLGQMLAGIAHEINNPVSFITGNLIPAKNYMQDLLDLIDCYQQHYPNPVPDVQECIEEIDLEFLVEDVPKILSSMQMGADRIHEIVLSLRNFSRVDELEMKPVNIHEGIDNTLLILHNRLKPSGNNPGIMIVKEYGNLPPVECYAGQLNQVFMNIISNAIDALENHPEPRNITICTSLLTEDPELKFGNEEFSSNSQHLDLIPSVVIRIRDNGAGMTEDVVEHLFNPFFTTKPVGKGTGLGLSISYQIVVEKHGGILKCLSKPGQGAEFWIQIPIAPPAIAMPNGTSD